MTDVRDEIVLRAPVAGDIAALARLAAVVPAHDLLFLARDIREPKVLEAWLRAEATGDAHSLIALAGGEIVAALAALSDRFSWSPHVCELRLLVAPAFRNRGLGRRMLAAAVDSARERGATKLTARMTPDQTGAITLFEEHGFRAEALLRDHVRDSDGTMHDLAVLALDSSREGGLREAYGN